MVQRVGQGIQAAKAAATRQRLIDAAIKLVRVQGYNATSVDQLCAEAGVTKGAFFHHFANKEALAAQAALYWGERANLMFGKEAASRGAAALDRVLAYIDIRTAIMTGTMGGATCYAGTIAQELHTQSPPLREASREAIFGHAASLEPDIAEALEDHGVEGIRAQSLALHIQAVIQGAFVVAKADNDFAVAHDTMAHLRRYIEMLFEKGEPQ